MIPDENAGKDGFCGKANAVPGLELGSDFVQTFLAILKCVAARTFQPLLTEDGELLQSELILKALLFLLVH